MATPGFVLSGARAVLKIEGAKVMYCYDVSYGEQIQYEPIEPLDQLDVAEHVPLAYRVNFSAQVVRVIREPLRLHQGIEIYPRLNNILTSGELTATVEDRVTGTVVSNITGVKAESRNIKIGNRSIVMTDVSFVARRIIDESEI